MKAFQYLIIGGGMTADSAAKAIRKLDKSSEIAILSAESNPPYKRPPLSKGLWKGVDFNSIWLKTEEKKIDVFLETQVILLDPQSKLVEDKNGNRYGYDKLLLATGGTVRRLPFGDEHILYYRYVSDYLTLSRQLENKDHFTVLGGGYIGSEIAAGLRMKGKDITIVFPDRGIGSNIFPEDLSVFINDYYREKGIKVVNGELAQSLEREKDKWRLATDQQEILTDLVVAGIGIKPNINLAQSAGLTTGNGIIVDEYLRTSHPDIFAAGDAATIFNTVLQKDIRYEHEDNAVKMGDAAGKNMTGKAVRYDDYLPYFYSDLFELGYEAVGTLDSRFEIIADWQEKYKKGVVYYHQEGKVMGVLLWNVWGALNDARQVIKETQASPAAASDLIGRIG